MRIIDEKTIEVSDRELPAWKQLHGLGLSLPQALNIFKLPMMERNKLIIELEKFNFKPAMPEKTIEKDLLWFYDQPKCGKLYNVYSRCIKFENGAEMVGFELYVAKDDSKRKGIGDGWKFAGTAECQLWHGHTEGHGGYMNNKGNRLT